MIRTLTMLALVLCVASGSIRCTRESDPSDLRPAVDPSELLLPAFGFDGLSSQFSPMGVDRDAHRMEEDALGERWKSTYLKLWSSGVGGIRQEVRAFDDVGDAAQSFDDGDPRRLSLELSTINNVAPSRPFVAPGDPDQSQIHCGWADDGKDDTKGCAHWAWWARYGQYTVKVTVGSPSEPLTIIDERDFTAIIEQIAANIAAVLKD